jgi:carotenoid cleavage dioxygenase
MTLNNSIAQFALETQNPYIMGAFGPVDREIVAHDLKVIGEIPKDIHGVYVRNGPNQKFTPISHYHWFDGDGMLHAVHIENGKATYRNKWVQTDAFKLEEKHGECLYQGVMGNMVSNPRGSNYNLKDSANTAVAFFNNQLLTMWYMCGDIYGCDPITLETNGKETFGGTFTSKSMAHVKVDEYTNEMMFFDYGLKPPYMWYGVVGNNGQVKHFTEIPLPGPRLPHDMAITENYSILMDLPYINDPEALKIGRSKIVFRKDWPSRFAVIPRYGNKEQIKWFEANPCYIYHVINAWEEGDEIVMDTCITVNPAPQADAKGPVEKLKAYLRLEAFVHRYRFNLKDGTTKEYQLDDQFSEFPLMNAKETGRKTQFSYNQHCDVSEVFRFDGILKYDTANNSTQFYGYGEGVFGSESPFIPKSNATAEDDGYVITFVTNERTESSEVLILDAQNIENGPLARIQLPQRVPLGFHACWVPGDKLPA